MVKYEALVTLQRIEILLEKFASHDTFTDSQLDNLKREASNLRIKIGDIFGLLGYSQEEGSEYTCKK